MPDPEYPFSVLIVRGDRSVGDGDTLTEPHLQMIGRLISGVAEDVPCFVDSHRVDTPKLEDNREQEIAAIADHLIMAFRMSQVVILDWRFGVASRLGHLAMAIGSAWLRAKDAITNLIGFCSWSMSPCSPKRISQNDFRSAHFRRASYCS